MTAHTVELANVPRDDKPWWKQSHLLRLNWHIISLVMFCKLVPVLALPNIPKDQVEHVADLSESSFRQRI